MAENDAFDLKWNDIRLINVKLTDRKVEEDDRNGQIRKYEIQFSSATRQGQSNSARQLGFEFPTVSMWVNEGRTNNIYIDGFGELRMQVANTSAYGGGVRVDEMEVYLDADLLGKLQEQSGKRRSSPDGGWVITWEHRKPGEPDRKPLGQETRFYFNGDVRAGECPIRDCKISFTAECRGVFEEYRHVEVFRFEEIWPAELENALFKANRVEKRLVEREVLVPREYDEFKSCEDQLIKYEIDCLREEMETGWNSILEETDQHGLTSWDARDFARYGVNENDFVVVFSMEEGTIKNDVSASCRVPRAVFVDCPQRTDNY